MDLEERDRRAAEFRIIRDQMSEAVAAHKCHPCGCLHNTVEALSRTEAGQSELRSILKEARSVFKPKQYDCLGCAVCYPAIAANAFGKAFPDADLGPDLCPTEEPDEQQGWPPLPGNYQVVRYRAPVAVCTLNSDGLASELRDHAPDALGIVGTLHTENLGIERIIRNTLANPNLRFLILCGEDAQQAVGHLPGQSLQSLFENGVDERGRIRGARGKRPVLKNVTAGEIQEFVEQAELISMIGEKNRNVVGERIRNTGARDPGPYKGRVTGRQVEAVEAREPENLTIDRAGYFVVYPDARRERLVVEHYTNQGVLDCVIEGGSSPAVYSEAIRRNLLSRLDHAAYLGCELARAERALAGGEVFIQDKAPGGAKPSKATHPGCGCARDTCEGEADE